MAAEYLEPSKSFHIFMEAFFVISDEPADEGWEQVPGYDAWAHPETGCIVSGHQMRMARRIGFIPRSQATGGPWL